MPSASEILTRASRLTGLKTSGEEWDLVVDAYNWILWDICRRSGCSDTTASYTVTATADWYDASAFLGGASAIQLREVKLAQGAGTIRVKMVSPKELESYRDGAVGSGFPVVAAIMGAGTSRAKIGFYPNPSVGQVYKTWFTEKVAAVTTATASLSAAPTVVDEIWHMNLILFGVVAESMPKDQRDDKYKAWVGRYESKLIDFIEWATGYGGENPEIYFDDPVALTRYPDERNR